MNRNHGFTLLEVILAVSIMSLIVATLYMAFSQATRTWDTQNTLTENAKRMAIVTDMLTREFNSLRPYAYLHEKGRDYFFGASSTVLFYVTPQSFGAQRRTHGGLYFSCLYLMPNDLLNEEPERELSEDGLSLYLCKLDRPAPWLLEELIQFKTLSQDQKDNYIPGLDMREASVFLLDGFGEARFSCSDSTELPETQNATNPGEDILNRSIDDPGFELADLDLDQTIWSQPKMPTLVQLSLQSGEDEVRLIQGSPSYFQD